MSKNSSLFVQGTRLLKNFFSETDERVVCYSNVFDELLQQFRDRAAGDTLVVVHRIWQGMKGLEALGNVWLIWGLSCLF